MTSNSKVLSTGDVIICGYLLKNRRIELLRKLLLNLDCVKPSSEFTVRDWKRRYFILYKIHNQNRTEIFFDYYKDETVTKFKGRVDLENCECIVENANIGGRPCAFSITTLFNGNKRVYYFIAANNKIMSDWVQHLARVAELVDVSTTDVSQSNQRTAIVNNSNSCVGAVGGGCSAPPLFQRPSKIPSNKNSIDNSTSRDRGTKNSINDKHVNGNDSDNTGEGDYKDVIGGVDYLLSGPELLDDYHHLPDASHSYVNLTNSVETEKDFNRNYSSLPRSNNNDDKIKQTYIDDNSFKSSNGNMNNQKNNPLLNDTTSSSKNNIKRQNSSDSIYYNVWESEDGSKVTPNTAVSAATTDSVLGSEICCKQGSQKMTSNTRIYRKSHYLPGNSTIVNSSLQPSFDQNSNQCLLIKSTTVNRKPEPPPRMSPLKSLSSTLPTSCIYPSNVLSELSLESPLPVRAKGLNMSLDSSGSSGSSTCSDMNTTNLDITRNQNTSATNDENADNVSQNNSIMNDDEVNNSSLKEEENKENRIQSFDHRGIIGKNQPLPHTANIGKSSKVVNNKISHLNYIEPYNLDLRATVQCSAELASSCINSFSFSSCGTIVLAPSIVSISTATTTIHLTKISDIPSNVTSSSTLSCMSSSSLLVTSHCSNPIEKQSTSTNCSQQTVISSLIHSVSSSNNNNFLLSNHDPPIVFKSNKPLISCNSNNTTTVTTNNSNNQSNDEHIEYREIDPIGTNALAIVKERFG
ncbi:GRB2 associated binding protein 3 [Schistosoma japonicum]|nr:GRB2 associated binding protein 3 [Schistosoma japonicum]KAH8872588.1 GRB2 associated binding protein 3 [Schistosoma japonicum]